MNGREVGLQFSCLASTYFVLVVERKEEEKEQKEGKEGRRGREAEEERG